MFCGVFEGSLQVPTTPPPMMICRPGSGSEMGNTLTGVVPHAQKNQIIISLPRPWDGMEAQGPRTGMECPVATVQLE